MHYLDKGHFPLLLLYILSGILIGASLIFAPLWWCAFPGSILFLSTLARPQRMRTVIFGSFITGILKAGMSFAWMFAAYPVDWLPDTSHAKQLFIIGGFWLSGILCLSIGYIFFGVVVHRIRTKYLYLYPVIYGFLFVISEIIGSFFFSLGDYGVGSSLEPYFGFGFIGFSMAYHGILKNVAAIAGVYGLTFTLIFFSTMVVLSLQTQTTQQKKVFLLVLCIGLYTLSGFFSFPQAHTSGTPIAAIATRFHSDKTMSGDALALRKGELSAGIESALGAGARAVVLPEDARFSYRESTQNIFMQLARTTHVAHAVVVDSYRTDITPSSVVLRSYVYDIDARKTYTADKRDIVPAGEYLPYIPRFIVAIVGGLEYFSEMHYVSSNIDISPEAPSYIPNVLFCFESGHATLTKTKIDVRASTLIAHPVSHGWFHAPSSLWNEERQMLIVQAIFAHTPILQAGNNAPSELYTADGRVLQGKVIENGDEHTTLLFSL